MRCQMTRAEVGIQLQRCSRLEQKGRPQVGALLHIQPAQGRGKVHGSTRREHRRVQILRQGLFQIAQVLDDRIQPLAPGQTRQ